MKRSENYKSDYKSEYNDYKSSVGTLHFDDSTLLMNRDHNQ